MVNNKIRPLKILINEIDIVAYAEVINTEKSKMRRVVMDCNTTFLYPNIRSPWGLYNRCSSRYIKSHTHCQHPDLFLYRVFVPFNGSTTFCLVLLNVSEVLFSVHPYNLLASIFDSLLFPGQIFTTAYSYSILKFSLNHGNCLLCQEGDLSYIYLQKIKCMSPQIF